MALLVENYESADEIPEALKEYYVEKEIDGKTSFVLENIEPLKNAKSHEKEARKEAEAKAKELEEKVAEYAKAEAEKQAALDAEKLRQLEKDKNWTEIEKINQEKRDNEKAEHEAQLKVLQDSIAAMKLEKEQEKVSAVCTKVAAAIGISGEPESIEALQDLIKLRRTKTVDGQVVLLNKDGQAVSWNTTELADDIKVDPRFARLIAGSKASGGPTGGANTYTGGGAYPKDKKWSELTKAEKMAKIKSGKK